jgi:amino acid transporter
VLYLSRLWPAVAAARASLAVGVGVVLGCAAMNLRGARAVGKASEGLGLLLLAPFVVLCVLAWLAPSPTVAPPAAPPNRGDFAAGLLVALWNFMGWDNASTVAGEVETPQRNYPRAVLATLALVMLTYLGPVAAAARSGLPAAAFTTGAWVDAGRSLGGPLLATAMVVGGMACGLGMMDALVMSYSRLPLVLAREGYLPRACARQLPGTAAPWVSILVLALAWSLALGLGFERLIELDVVLYGLSLLLEFAALVSLRIREPDLPRPFRVPGGLPVALLLGLGPAALLVVAFARERAAHPGRIGAIVLGAVLLLIALPLYAAAAWFRRRVSR